MNSDLSQLAIAAALCGDWQKALEINSEIIKTQGNSPDVLNRVARAYAELGELEKARKTAQKVLDIDPFNTIAHKCLLRWKNIKNGNSKSNSQPNVLSAQTFLEEPGKTRILNLLHLGDADCLLNLDCGDELRLVTHPHSISVSNLDGKHIGKLPDDIAYRLRKLMNEGNTYKIFVKSAQSNEVKVFIRELKRAKNISHIASFPTEKLTYVAYASPQLVHNKRSTTSG